MPNNALNEFALIQRYFQQKAPAGHLGVGDDCALLPVRAGQHLAISTDTLIEGQHFFSDVSPAALGHKVLAVSLSDLAAMGATPTGCVLALALPRVDENWLQAFSTAFTQLANAAECPLLGGDTTRHPAGITITVTVFGEVPSATALRRSAAQPGDDIWLTGTLGGAHLALQYLTGALAMDATRLAQSRDCLEWPQPPYRFAPQLVGRAHAAIDISDGLLQDFSHIAKASACGATFYYDQLPIHPALHGVSSHVAQSAVLTGGDVFQLCFTAPPKQRDALYHLAQTHGISLSQVGAIHTEPVVQVLDKHQQAIVLPTQGGFDHFSV